MRIPIVKTMNGAEILLEKLQTKESKPYFSFHSMQKFYSLPFCHFDFLAHFFSFIVFFFFFLLSFIFSNWAILILEENWTYTSFSQKPIILLLSFFYRLIAPFKPKGTQKQFSQYAKGTKESKSHFRLKLGQLRIFF